MLPLMTYIALFITVLGFNLVGEGLQEKGVKR